MSGTEWVIWSFEHDRWWGAMRSGYVDRLMWAGLYSEEEANQIANDSNRRAVKPAQEAMHVTAAVKREMLNNPNPHGRHVGDVMRFPDFVGNADAEPCSRCDGCGEIANDVDGTPWKYWQDLPPGADLAVKMGLVKAIPCPECLGTKLRKTT